MFAIQAQGALKQGLWGFRMKQGERLGTEWHGSRGAFMGRAELWFLVADGDGGGRAGKLGQPKNKVEGGQQM